MRLKPLYCNGLCCILENNCLKLGWKFHLKNTLKCKKKKTLSHRHARCKTHKPTHKHNETILQTYEDTKRPAHEIPPTHRNGVDVLPTGDHLSCGSLWRHQLRHLGLGHLVIGDAPQWPGIILDLNGKKGWNSNKELGKKIEIGNKYYEYTAVYLGVYGRILKMGGQVYDRILAVYGRILGVYGRIPWVYGRIHKVYGRIPRPWHWGPKGGSILKERQVNKWHMSSSSCYNACKIF